MVGDVRNIHAFRNKDATIFLVVSSVHLWIVFNIEGWSICWCISAVWCAFLIEDWIDVELNKVIVSDSLVSLGVVQHNIIAELLESIW